eukprot:3360522-Heterocapsa_arctica.AAC.1
MESPLLKAQGPRFAVCGRRLPAAWPLAARPAAAPVAVAPPGAWGGVSTSDSSKPASESAAVRWHPTGNTTCANY